MSKRLKICVVKSWVGTIAYDQIVSRRHCIRSIAILTICLLSMLATACGPNISSNHVSSPNTNPPQASVTDTLTPTKGKPTASSTTTPAATTFVTKSASSKTPSQNQATATVATTSQGSNSTTAQPTATPHQSNPTAVSTPIVEADPTSFTVTIHGFSPTLPDGHKNTQQKQPVELDNAASTGVINWSVLVEMFDGKDHGWLSVSPSSGTVKPGKPEHANIVASVPSTMPPGEYKGCVEFLPPSPQDHCNNPDDAANKEVAVDLIVAAPPTPQPVVAPTPTPQPVVVPTPTPQPVVAPTPTPQPVVVPTPTPQPVVAPTPTPQSMVAPTVLPT